MLQKVNQEKKADKNALFRTSRLEVLSRTSNKKIRII